MNLPNIILIVSWLISIIEFNNYHYDQEYKEAALSHPDSLYKLILSKKPTLNRSMAIYLANSKNIDRKIYYINSKSTITYTPLQLTLRSDNADLSYQLFCHGVRPCTLVTQKLFLLQMDSIKDFWNNESCMQYLLSVFEKTDILKTSMMLIAELPTEGLFEYAIIKKRRFLFDSIYNFLTTHVLDESYYTESNIDVIIQYYHYKHPQNTFSKKQFLNVLETARQEKKPLNAYLQATKLKID